MRCARSHYDDEPLVLSVQPVRPPPVYTVELANGMHVV
jgi:hypothetical protein